MSLLTYILAPFHPSLHFQNSFHSWHQWHEVGGCQFSKINLCSYISGHKHYKSGRFGWQDFHLFKQNNMSVLSAPQIIFFYYGKKWSLNMEMDEGQIYVFTNKNYQNTHIACQSAVLSESSQNEAWIAHTTLTIRLHINRDSQTSTDLSFLLTLAYIDANY